MSININVLLTTLLVLYIPPSSAQNRSVCLKEEFSCREGTCISDTLLCDGNPDCANGLDELVCSERPPFGCRPNSRPCGADTTECVLLQHICDGVAHCINGQDEANCPARDDSPCLSSQFQCLLTPDTLINNVPRNFCIPLQFVCNCQYDCGAGEDEQNCGLPVVTILPETSVTVFAGTSRVTMLCDAEGHPMPSISWLKNFREIEIDRRINMISSNGMGVLIIDNVTVFDEGLYSCVITQSMLTTIANQSTNLTVLNPTPVMCEDSNGRKYTEGDVYYTNQSILTEEAINAAVDITFIVDESGSMGESHKWIVNAASLLDESLRNAGIGIGNYSNLFALVAYGRNSNPEGMVLSQLTSVEGFINASRELVLTGLFEDGYSAIDVALNQIIHRNNTIRVFILVTNEDRQVLPGKEGLTRSLMEQRLKNAGVILNSVVRQGFLYDGADANSFAFGLNSNGTAYAFNTQTVPFSFTTYPDGVRHPDPIYNEGNTYETYVKLAFALGGAAWHIEQLELSQDFIAPFSEAFVKAKMEEITLHRRCLRCTCGKSCIFFNDLNTNCEGLFVPDLIEVMIRPRSGTFKEGDNVTLTCSIYPIQDTTHLTFRWFSVREFDLCSSPRARCYGDSITISDLEVADSGAYTCMVIGLQAPVPALGAASLTVHGLPAVNITEYPLNVRIGPQGKLMFRCVASGTPTPIIVWKKLDGNPLDDSEYLVEDMTRISVLTIDMPNLSHEGVYQCSAINCNGQATSSVNITLNNDCVLPNGTAIDVGTSEVVLYTPTLGADIILIVDESRSMSLQHQWIVNMTQSLNNMLVKLNVGLEDPNLFGMIGFGSDQGNRILKTSSGMVFVNATNITLLVDQLLTSGSMEDGYDAIQLGIDTYQFRKGAKQFILISDEERDVLAPHINKTNILENLKQNRAILNAVVTQSFQDQLGIRSLGIDIDDTTYIYDPLASNYLRVGTNGVPVKDSAYSTTYSDYTQLALASGGAAWDLGLLTQGSDVSTAFTEAFVVVKAREITKQIARCFNCTCYSAGISCTVLDLMECDLTSVFNSLMLNESDNSIVVSVQPDLQQHIDEIGDAYLTCTVQNGAGSIVWTFNGGILPDDVEVVSDGTVSTLRINPVTSNHKGTYSCIVHDGMRTGVDTGIIEVMDQTLFNLTVVPDNSVIPFGQNHTINCSIDVPAHITWHFNYQPTLPNNVIVTNELSLSYLTIIGATASSNFGRYTCIVRENITGLTSSVDAIIDVDETISISVPYKTVMTFAGTVNFSLVCTLDCCEGADITWTRSGGRLPNNAKVIRSDDGMSSTLLFSTITLYDCNLYICQASKDQQFVKTSVILNVKEPFRVVVRELASAAYGEVGVLSCQSYYSSSPDVTFQWMLNNSLIDSDNIERYTDRSLLILNNVNDGDIGTYTCIASNSNRQSANTSFILSSIIVINTSTQLLLSPSLSVVTSSVIFTQSADISTTVDLSPSPTEVNLPSSVDLPSSSNIDLPISSSINLPISSSIDLPSSSSIDLPSSSSVDLPISSSINLPISSSINLPSSSSIDLPSSSSVDLPISSSINLPISSSIDLPSSSSIDLPSSSSIDLPISSSINLPISSSINLPISSSIDLPSSSSINLPSSSSVDLPSSSSIDLPISSSINLPISSSIDLPISSSINLPISSSIDLPSSSSINLPSSPSVDLPSSPSIDLPSSPSIDLPSSPSIDLPSSSSIDLPSSPSIDLPSSSSIDLPSSPSIDLPSSPSIDLPSSSSIDLPSSSSVDLPISSSVHLPSSPSIDLPSSSSSDLPSSSSVDLPISSSVHLPSSSSIDLPSSPSIDLPSSSSVDLPISSSVHLPSSSSIDLPSSPSIDLPSSSSVDLPISSSVHLPSSPSIGGPPFISSSSFIVPSQSISSSVMMSPTPTPPLLTIKIQSSDGFLYFLPNADVNITCISNILDKTAITWTFNGSSNLESSIYTVTPSDSGSVLNIRNFDVNRNVGHYMCKAQLGTQMANDTVTVVDGTIRLSTNVSNAFLSVGESIIVTCTSSIPVDNIEWIYTPSPAMLPSNVQSMEEDKIKAHLVITNFISSSNQGNYQCMATRDGRTVSTPLQINERVELSLSAFPKNTIRAVQDVQPDPSKNIVLTCRITCPCGGATVSWMIPPDTPDPKPQNTVSFTRRMATLTFNRLQQSYTQEFCCRATHPTLGLRDDCVTVEILPDAVVSVTPEEIQVPDGSTFTFNCTSNRKVTLFFWTYNLNERTLPRGVSYRNVSDTLSQLTVTGATKDVNTGLYYCHAMYAETGETTRDAGNLLIEPPGASVNFDKTSPLMYRVGDSISIECQLDCLCFGEVHWKFNNDMNNFNGLTHSRSFTRREATLSTNSATQSMAGTYTCEIIAGPFAGTEGTFELVLMN